MEWKTTDAAIAMLRRKSAKRFSQTVDAIQGFDEINVQRQGNELYANLKADNEKAFMDLAKRVYREAEVHGNSPPDKKWLLALLAAYFAVTGYVYDHEVDRKKAYFIEGVLSEALNGEIRKEALRRQAKRAVRYWDDMTYEYADDVTDKARLKAFKDVGVRKVKWNAILDKSTCQDCYDLNGTIFDIDSVPDKPHRKCRCWVTPVKV